MLNFKYKNVFKIKLFQLGIVLALSKVKYFETFKRFNLS